MGTKLSGFGSGGRKEARNRSIHVTNSPIRAGWRLPTTCAAGALDEMDLLLPGHHIFEALFRQHHVLFGVDAKLVSAPLGYDGRRMRFHRINSADAEGERRPDSVAIRPIGIHPRPDTMATHAHRVGVDTPIDTPLLAKGHRFRTNLMSELPFFGDLEHRILHSQ